MDEAIGIIFGNSLRNPFGPFHMHISVAEVLCRIIPSDQIEDDIRMSYTLLDGLSVSQVELIEVNSSKITSDFQVSFCHLFSVRYYDATSLSSKSIDDIATEEACCTKDCCCITSEG